MSDENVAVIPLSEDAEETQLRNAAIKADQEIVHEQAPDSASRPESTDSADQPEKRTAGEEEEDKSDKPETAADRGDGRNAKGRFVNKDSLKPGEQATGKEKTGEPSGEQGKQQAQPNKDQARLAKSWQKVEQEKLEVRQTLAEVRQLKQQLAQQQQQPRGRFGSRDYAAAANQFERDAAKLMEQGDTEEAQKHLNLAREARRASQHYAQQEHHEQFRAQSENFSREWQRQAQTAIDKHPALADPGTEEAQAMIELLEEFPILGYIPDGFVKGVQILEMRRDAAGVSGLRTELEKTQKELKDLRERTAITGGDFTGRISPKDFDSMSLPEMEKFLERQSRAADAAHVG